MTTSNLLEKRAIWLSLGLLLAAAGLVACAGGEAATPCPEPTECPDVECPEADLEIPFEALWVGSGHADATAEAFIHWDEDDPAEVPAGCAKCHSAGGFFDFLGLDGTEAGTVDNAAPIGTVVTCVVCHNEATVVMDSVVFPSGVEIAGLGDESRCMQCHQGRSSTPSVDEAIAEAGVDDDTVSEDLGFINIHYYPAAATKYGTLVKGGYEYEGGSYDGRFDHVLSFDTCIECHDPHTLEVRVRECSTCHQGVASAEDLRDVRMQGSLVDYDGDGDVSEGIYYEIAGLQEQLYAAIQAYAVNTTDTAIAYDAHTHPYFFIDTNADGEVSEDEADRTNQYNAWTPRLVKAAYNYQVSIKDPGAYAHGGKYIIQLLYDSIADLGGSVGDLNRIDIGHFAGSEEAFRHWDEDGEVETDCARCHSATGLPTYLAEGVNVAEPLANGFLCSTCHDDLVTFSRYVAESVAFPSGAALALENPDSNLCLNCHQGRESTVSVNELIAGLPLDTVDEDLSFGDANVHYYAAGATLFGAEAQGAYQYEGRVYAGPTTHPDSYDECAECHTAHGLGVREELCGACHDGVEEPHEIRMSATDFDGDGDVEEGIAGEIETMHEALYAAIQGYANVNSVAIIYDAHAYPYFFIDTDANGEVDPGEAIFPNQYNAWTPRMLRAAYNYQYVAKDPGTFAHNPLYIIQILYDTLVDIGGNVSGMARP